jgi:SDR family mycofactocin-dependent oxidoreductase
VGDGVSPAKTRRVAVITGAARGQGRSHAVTLAGAGFDIVGIDLCADLATVPYPLATPEDLEQTVVAVEKAGGQMIARRADVRDFDALRKAIDDGLSTLGRVDVVLPNAGVAALDATEPDRRARFRDVVDINLVGVWNTVECCVPTMIEAGRGGCIVLTSSVAGLRGCLPGSSGGDAYVASKHALVGLARNWANAWSRYEIRVNTVHPTGVRTPMVENAALARFHNLDPVGSAERHNLLPVPMVEPIDVSNAIAWLISDEARYVTGVSLPIDAGWSARA